MRQIPSAVLNFTKRTVFYAMVFIFHTIGIWYLMASSWISYVLHLVADVPGVLQSHPTDQRGCPGGEESGRRQSGDYKI